MILIEPIRRILDAAQRLDAGELCAELWKDEHLQSVIVDLNTKRQLFDEGIRADGSIIRPEYAPLTVDEKLDKGLPDDRVTLFDTGEYYLSHEVTPAYNGFYINADDGKGEGGQRRWLSDKYGKLIIGLTYHSKKVLGENAKPKFIELAKEKLFKP